MNESTEFATALNDLAAFIDSEAPFPLLSVSYTLDPGSREGCYRCRWGSDPRDVNVSGLDGLVLATIAGLRSQPSGRFRVEHTATGLYENGSRPGKQRPLVLRGIDRQNGREWLASQSQSIRDHVATPFAA